ncbi:amino acid/polyamine/organocation transporter, APC superfamily [Modicisalibacter muralis]|uniref:Amino acid/polyamine/organocation transporter, APC superfamily n=1 Tax=Modicisalibacter muralis TaxID=119000 RepID=A0A1G9R8V7_9GAMM|nr:APC family permease [Halomonas muralis]SDM19729.1 amino acid/polyamine/organocation transporter, APC superfamily [Halomonas muralis]
MAKPESVTGEGAQTGESSGKLSRSVSTPLLLAFVTGNIVGAGIYVAPGEVAAQVGGGIWLPFLIAFVVALLTAFSYAELVSKYPRAGGAALFVHRGYRIPIFSFLAAFAVMCSALASASGIAHAFGGDYLETFIDLPEIAVAVVFILILALINYLGILGSARLNMVLTIISVIGLLVVIVVGIAAIAQGQADFSQLLSFDAPGGEEVGGLVIIGAATVAFYALIGFEDSANMAEEAKDASRAYPRALFGGLLLAGGLYIAVCLVAAIVVPAGTLAGSSGPLLEVVNAGPIPIPPALFSIAALVGITNTALINLIIASRVLYGMGCEGVLPSAFGKVDPRRRTPVVAIVFTTALALVLALTGDFGDLSKTTVLLLLAIFAIVNVTTLVLRRDRVSHEHFTAPFVIPILGALTCVILLTQQQPGIWLRAVILVAIGLVLYLGNLAFKRRAGEVSV